MQALHVAPQEIGEPSLRRLLRDKNSVVLVTLWTCPGNHEVILSDSISISECIPWSPDDDATAILHFSPSVFGILAMWDSSLRLASCVVGPTLTTGCHCLISDINAWYVD